MQEKVDQIDEQGSSQLNELQEYLTKSLLDLKTKSPEPQQQTYNFPPQIFPTFSPLVRTVTQDSTERHQINEKMNKFIGKF